MTDISTILLPDLADSLRKAGIDPQFPISSCEDGWEGEATAETWPDGWDKAKTLNCLDTAPLAHFCTVALDHLTDHFVFPWHDGEAVVLLAVTHGSAALNGPMRQADVAALVAADFQPLRSPPPLAVDLELESDALFTLFAFFDYCRYIYAASLIERIEVPLLQFTPDELWQQWTFAQAKPDYRWFLCLWPLLKSDDDLPGENAITAGLGKLADLKLVKVAEHDSAYCLPATGLLSIALQFVNLSPVTIFPDAKPTALMAGEALWLYESAGANHRLRSVDPIDLIAYARARILGDQQPQHPPQDTAESESEPQIADTYCAQCAAPFEYGQKFCKSCGAALN